MNPSVEATVSDGATLLGATVQLPGPRPAVLVPVGHDGRVVGAYVISAEHVRFAPVVDVGRIVPAAFATAAVITAVVTAGTVAARRRPGPTVGPVTMGPGGWLSVRGAGVGRLCAHRPWWARLLRARRLVVQR